MRFMTNLTIDQQWCDRPADAVASELIGCTLVRQFSNGYQLRGMIVETEAYGPDDPACHGYRGRTPRTEVMFGPAGMSYVYFIYGMYHCFNVVTDQENVASAVLIRALELEAIPEWVPDKKRKQPHRIAAGPGKLCQVMQIDRTLSDRPLNPSEALWLEPCTIETQQKFVDGIWTLHQTTRIGLSQATETPWRWYLKESKSVSKP
ncbi:MAG: DNA-3-methyladenine glycosylase [Cyanobacteria bacterium P01_F01_bin.150]